MAIDPEEFGTFRRQLDTIVEEVPGGAKHKDLIINQVLGDALNETEELFDDSRPLVSTSSDDPVPGNPR